jgi:hypothetical protein
MRWLALIGVLAAALLVGCGTPGGDSGDNAEKAKEAEQS